MMCLFPVTTSNFVQSSLAEGSRVLVREGRQVIWDMWRRGLHWHNNIGIHVTPTVTVLL